MSKTEFWVLRDARHTGFLAWVDGHWEGDIIVELQKDPTTAARFTSREEALEAAETDRVLQEERRDPRRGPDYEGLQAVKCVVSVTVEEP